MNDRGDGITIRSATLDDAQPLAGLVTELGYPATADQMRSRLSAILQDRDWETLVACAGPAVVGFVGTRSGPHYEGDGRYGQIVAMVVTASHQRRGVGRTLLREAESRLVEHGARFLVLTSGNQRSGAHAFYESMGYEFTGRRYKKRIQPERVLPSARA